MAKARSPSYPSISLREAVEKIERVYKRDYQNAISRELVAQHMGYQGINGKSLGILAAIGKYGLLEGRGNESRVSDLAVLIIAHPPGSPDRRLALMTAADRPELFAELDAKFGGGKGSDQAIRAYLLTQKFIPAGAELAIRAYRDTKRFLEEEGVGNTVDLIKKNTDITPVPEFIAPREDHPPRHVVPPQLVDSEKKPFVVEVMSDRLRVTANLTNAVTVEALIDILQRMKSILPEKPAAPQAEPHLTFTDFGAAPKGDVSGDINN